MQSRRRSRLRMSGLDIVPSGFDGHTFAIDEFLGTTIQAVKGPQLPLGHVHAATQAETETQKHEDTYLAHTNSFEPSAPSPPQRHSWPEPLDKAFVEPALCRQTDEAERSVDGPGSALGA